ncbi:arg8-vasotocin receptor [Patella vulgata]|uniref:arg8-vasotocin receptor n=1 Tax=Patella vulgata TaxID=6465 RepID=UPI002180391B|nr:arg8-vasotocin receptor [Patella vulgata]
MTTDMAATTPVDLQITDTLASLGNTIYHMMSTSSPTNTTISTNNLTIPDSVHDMEYDVMIRLVCLYIVIVLGAIGGLLVCLWMWYNRKHRSRVNALILNLCAADMLVIFVACLPQLVWEHMEREWLAGGFLCKTYKFCMSFSMFASANMLVVIAIDRHQAIRSPLREPAPVWMMCLVGWGFAALTSVPLFFVFHIRYDPIKEMYKCENTFRGKPMIHRQAFLTYAAIVSFLLPLIILVISYIRIFLKIAQKAAESKNSKRQSFKPGKIHLTSTANTSLPKAKIKTLKMTVVIVAAYVICGLPYFVAEMIMSYDDYHKLSQALYGILGGIAAANSAANPFVFLLFNANWQCVRGLKLCPSQNNAAKRSFVYSSASTRSEYSTVYVRSPPIVSSDTYELTTVRGTSR